MDFSGVMAVGFIGGVYIIIVIITCGADLRLRQRQLSYTALTENTICKWKSPLHHYLARTRRPVVMVNYIGIIYNMWTVTYYLGKCLGKRKLTGRECTAEEWSEIALHDREKQRGIAMAASKILREYLLNAKGKRILFIIEC